MTFIFDKLTPPPEYMCSKDDLNQFLVNSSAKNSLRRAKNVVFFLFCILVDRPMGRAIASPRTPLPLATLLTQNITTMKRLKTHPHNHVWWHGNYPRAFRIGIIVFHSEVRTCDVSFHSSVVCSTI